MANSHFSFKQFSVNQDKCAMKVGTDGVLLGAWTDIRSSGNALDIGTGTGLIALMLAQRNPNLAIKAIDIDQMSVLQAKENVASSPFSERVSIHHTSLQSLAYEETAKYDLIVSNPPYFIQSLKSPNEQRSLARHTDSLAIEELINISSRFLSNKGRLSIIFPYEYKYHLKDIGIAYSLYTTRITTVFSTPSSLPKRVLMEFSKKEKTLVEENLVIERARHVYTDEFISLVKNFYLKM